MKIVLGILLLMLVLLQVRLWTGAGSLAEINRLDHEIAEQAVENGGLEARNQELMDEVSDLKNGLDSIEERARSELGLIRKGETFFLIVEEEPVHEQSQASLEAPLEEPALEIPPLLAPEIGQELPQAIGEDIDQDSGQDIEQVLEQELEEEANPYLELFRDEDAGQGTDQRSGQESGQ